MLKCLDLISRVDVATKFIGGRSRARCLKLDMLYLPVDNVLFIERSYFRHSGACLGTSSPVRREWSRGQVPFAFELLTELETREKQAVRNAGSQLCHF